MIKFPTVIAASFLYVFSVMTGIKVVVISSAVTIGGVGSRVIVYVQIVVCGYPVRMLEMVWVMGSGNASQLWNI